jgi:hypothetical protein
MPNMVRRKGREQEAEQWARGWVIVTEGEVSHDGVLSGSGSIYICSAVTMFISQLSPRRSGNFIN